LSETAPELGAVQRERAAKRVEEWLRRLNVYWGIWTSPFKSPVSANGDGA
jgi:hypothetical protein